MNVKRVLISSGLVIGAVATTTPALADDVEAGAAADANLNGGGASGGMDANGANGATGVSASAPALWWSKSIVDRPLFLGKGKIEAYGDIDIIRTSATNPVTMMTSSTTAEGLSIGAGYGITDKINAGINYAFALHDFEIKGPLTLYGSYDIVHNDKLMVGASAGLQIHFTGGRDMMGNSTATETILAGLGVRYRVIPKLSVFTGGTGFPNPLGPAFGSAYGPLIGSMLGQHLAIGLNSGAPISFDIPVGAGYQATPELYVGASTSIGHIGISNNKSGFVFADFIPLNVGALYAVNDKIDAGASLVLPDLKSAQFDLMFFSVNGRYHY